MHLRLTRHSPRKRNIEQFTVFTRIQDGRTTYLPNFKFPRQLSIHVLCSDKKRYIVQPVFVSYEEIGIYIIM
jgi:hypothetical protein